MSEIEMMWEQICGEWEQACRKLDGRINLKKLTKGDEIGELAVELEAVHLRAFPDVKQGQTIIESEVPDGEHFILAIWPRLTAPPCKVSHLKRLDADYLPQTNTRYLSASEMVHNAFQIRTNDVRKAELWLDDDVLESLCEVFDYHFVISDGALRAGREGWEYLSSTLRSALRASASLASSGFRKNISRWRKLADQIPGEFLVGKQEFVPINEPILSWKHSDQDLQLVISRDRLYPRSAPRSLGVQVRLIRDVPVEAIVLCHETHVEGLRQVSGIELPKSHLNVFTSDETTAIKRLDHQTRELIESTHPTMIELVENQVSLFFRGMLLEAERYRLAGRLATHISRPVGRHLYR